MRQMGPCQVRPVGLLDGVLLHEHPLVTAVDQGPHELVGDVGVVGKRHLGRREPPHAAQGLEAEEGGEMVLPGTHVQPEVLHRRRRRDGMAPCGAEPLHRLPVPMLTGDERQRLQHIAGTHVVQPVEEGSRVVEHHPGPVALVDQLRDELTHALVAPAEHRGVVVVTDLTVVVHPLQVAHDCRRTEVGSSGGDQGLMHVQRDGEGGVDLVDVEPTLAGRSRRRLTNPSGADRLLDQRFGPTDVRQSVDAGGKLAHHLWRMCS